MLSCAIPGGLIVHLLASVAITLYVVFPMLLPWMVANVLLAVLSWAMAVFCTLQARVLNASPPSEQPALPPWQRKHCSYPPFQCRSRAWDRLGL